MKIDFEDDKEAGKILVDQILQEELESQPSQMEK